MRFENSNKDRYCCLYTISRADLTEITTTPSNLHISPRLHNPIYRVTTKNNREFWPAVRGSWVVSFFFCPLQFVTFRYLPLEFRVLSVNVCDIAWTSVLSYFSHKAPPQKEAARIDDGGAGTRALGRRERTTRQQHSPAKNSRNSGFNRRNASGSSSSGVNGPARDSKHLSEARA